MKTTSGRFAILSIMALLPLAGCSEVKGVVTDFETGAPIEDAQVGLVVFRPFSILPAFPEVARTDASGQYQFVHNESNPWIYVHASGYLTQAEPLPRVLSLNRNFRLQSIGDLIGDWDVAITIAGTLLGDTRFTFTENGVEWTSSLGFSGEFYFEFDGTKVSIDSAITQGGDQVVGDILGSLTLDDSGDTLRGTIWLGQNPIDPDACQDGCQATLVAVRVGAGR